MKRMEGTRKEQKSEKGIGRERKKKEMEGQGEMKSRKRRGRKEMIKR